MDRWRLRQFHDRRRHLAGRIDAGGQQMTTVQQQLQTINTQLADLAKSTEA
uniref:t-SNARE coiled-coil homology domain-containing protein n=1 Tax=Heterorhabditis bacteriophora TaxID=37862 RepID=A0A1I7WDM0_HETBA